MSQVDVLLPGSGRCGFIRNVGIVVALILAAPPAIAASRQSQERTARRACLSGDYAKGIDILSGLFVQYQDAIYIFNQGRCLEQNQQYKDAIARFQEALRTEAAHPLSAGDRLAAEKHIASCKESLAEQAGPAQATPPPIVVEPAPAPTPEPVVAPEANPIVIGQPGTPAAPSEPGSGLRMTGIVLASIGVAGLAAGLGFNLLANKKVSDMESQKDGYSDGRNADHKTYVTLTWVGYGMGAACLATGAVLYTVGYLAKAKSSGNVSVVPTFGLGQAGAAFVGAF